MIRIFHHFKLVSLLLALLLSGGCVGDPGTTSTSPTGYLGKGSSTGGATSGGTTPFEGTASSGGLMITGGIPSTGGLTASGGVSSTGGASSAGGKTSTGGTTTAGGMAASGGITTSNRDSGVIDVRPPDTRIADTTPQITGGTSACTPAANAEKAVHRAGSICINCHGPGGDSPTITVAGTVYSTSAGGTPLAGATIKIGTLTMVTDKGGTFYSQAKVTLDSPTVGKCPDADKTMPTKPSQADCNGCHKAGNRIHLP